MWYFLNDRLENCHCSQEQVEEYSEEFFSDGNVSALLKSIPSVDKSCLPAKKKDSYQDFLSGMMSKPSMEDHGKDQLTLFQEVFPAKTSPQRVPVRELPANVQAWFSRCYVLLKKFNQDMSLSKTALCYVPEDWVSFSEYLPNWGMTVNGACWGRGILVRPIEEAVYGFLLPGVTRQGNELSPYMMNKWKAHKNLQKFLEKNIQLPTPTAQRYGSNIGGGMGRVGKKRESLESLAGGVRIHLREWMMWYPINWTAIKPLETGRFQEWLYSHGKLLRVEE